MDMDAELLDRVVEISVDAGKKILEVYETDFSVEHKDDKSPLTAADMAAHHAIVDGLHQLTPDIPILSEESASIPYDIRKQWHSYWLVDPLDGTREFVKRNGEFTVNIAFIEDNQTRMGVVYAPVLDVTYAATEGVGAWKRQDKGERQAIHARQFAATCPTVAGSRSHRGDSLNSFLHKLGEHELISMGSSLKMCLGIMNPGDMGIAPVPSLWPDFRVGYRGRAGHCRGSGWPAGNTRYAADALQHKGLVTEPGVHGDR